MIFDSSLSIFTAICLCVVIYWIYWRWANRRLLQLAALLPGPKPLPIIGNALIFMTQPEEQLNKLAGLIAKYGDYLRFWLGPDLNIIVKNPADIRLLLTSNKVNHKGPLYEFMKEIIGPGILTGGPTWRNHRKIATPSYNKKSVQHFCDVFNREAADLASTLARKDPHVTFDVYHDVVNCTTQCVCQTLMGLSKRDSLNMNRMAELVEITQSMYGHIFQKMTHWWLQIPFVGLLLGVTKKDKYYTKAIDDMTSDILRKRQKELENCIPNDDAMGIVDRYLLSGELTEQEIKGETFTLFTTSQEASAKISSAVLLFLAHLPEWQVKVYREIVDVLGSQDQDLSEEQLKKLQYLDMVYKEVLRYLSIAAYIQRTVEDEISINEGKITLPAGTSLVIPIHEVHRDPRYWDEPLKVKPDRFLPENVRKRDPNAFIPFSLGPMDCLGRVFATVMIKTIVIRVLRRVELQADGCLEDLDLNVAISVKFAQGYNVRVRPRTQNGRSQQEILH